MARTQKNKATSGHLVPIYFWTSNFRTSAKFRCKKNLFSNLLGIFCFEGLLKAKIAKLKREILLGKAKSSGGGPGEGKFSSSHSGANFHAFKKWP